MHLPFAGVTQRNRCFELELSLHGQSTSPIVGMGLAIGSIGSEIYRGTNGGLENAIQCMGFRRLTVRVPNVGKNVSETRNKHRGVNLSASASGTSTVYTAEGWS